MRLDPRLARRPAQTRARQSLAEAGPVTAAAETEEGVKAVGMATAAAETEEGVKAGAAKAAVAKAVAAKAAAAGAAMAAAGKAECCTLESPDARGYTGTGNLRDTRI